VRSGACAANTGSNGAVSSTNDAGPEHHQSGQAARAKTVPPPAHKKNRTFGEVRASGGSNLEAERVGLASGGGARFELLTSVQSVKNAQQASRLLVAGILVFASVPAVAWADEKNCPPSATVIGPAGVVNPVRAILRAHGVDSNMDDCRVPGVRASLRAEPGARRYLLHIEDGFGRESDRHVGDAETVASLIESWVLPAGAPSSSLDSPTLPAWRSTLPGLTAPRAPGQKPPRDDAGRWRFDGALELARGSDDSSWYGGAATVCAQVGALCGGGRLRDARNGDSAGPSRDRHRTAAELLMLAALPLTEGAVTLTPVLGLGLGWVHTEVASPALDFDDVPTDLGMRVEAAASVALALGAHVGLATEVGVSWGRSLATSGTAGADGFAVDPPATAVRVALACRYQP
jgi:hypothetical protein